MLNKIKRNEVVPTALSSRQEFILSAIAEYYIATGQPVGSKLLLTALPFSVSSATVRNDMAALVQMGYLEQPHTSAGRIPSDKGLRFYADKLLENFSPADADVFRIVSGVDHFEGDPTVILGQAAGVLSDLTGTLVFASVPTAAGDTLTGVQIVPTLQRQAMVMVTTAAGRIATRIAKLMQDVSFDLIELFYNVTAANFTGRDLTQITPALLQRTAVSLGERALDVSPLLACVYEAVEECRSPKIVVKGQSALLDSPLAPVSGDILSLLDDLEEAAALLAGPDDVSIRIGAENAWQCLKYATLIRCGYKLSDSAGGAIAVIGPTQMDYARTLPLVKYVSDTLGTLLKDALETKSTKG